MTGFWSDTHAQALAATLLAFVWQGALIGAAAAVALRLARSASSRYAIGVAGLVAMLLAPLISFASLMQVSSAAASMARGDVPAATTGGISGRIVATDVRQAFALGMLARRGSDVGAVRDTPELLDSRAVPPAIDAIPTALQPRDEAAANLSSIIVTFWLTGVLILTVRLAGGWFIVQRLRRACRPVDVRLTPMLERLTERLQIRRAVAMVSSHAISVPTVVGWARPLVLIPACGLSGLSGAQLEAILAHELAHVRRHDYLVNLLQSGIETLLFYHPAVWWLSSRVRAEREHCCDDLAVEACGDRMTYVTALAELAARDAGFDLALAANDGSLVARVARLLGKPARRRDLPSASFGAFLLGAVVLAGAGPVGLLSAWRPSGEASVAFADVARATHATESAVNAAPALPIAIAQRAVVAQQPAEPVPPAAPEESAVVIEPAEIAEVPEVPAIPAAPEVPQSAREIPEAPPVPAPPSPPAAPAAPGVPEPPAPPMAPDQSIASKGEDRGESSWSSSAGHFRVEWIGRFALTDDERDVATMDEGSKLRIAEGRVFVTSVAFTGGRNGEIERRFYRNGVERAYEPEGRAWLAGTLPKLAARVFVEARVSRLLERGGPDAVLRAIDQLDADSGYLRRRYYEALLARVTPTPALLETIADRARRGTFSDYERARLLATLAASAAASDAARAQVVAASRRIQSDYEQRRVLMAAMPETLTPEAAARVLAAAADIEGAYERASLLTALAERGGVSSTTSDAFFRLVADMSSAYEQRRVLTALSRRSVSEEIALDAMKLVAAMGSDYERRQVLMSLLGDRKVTPPLAMAALAAAESLRSGHERSTLLLHLVERGGLSDETAGNFFHATLGLGGYEHRRVLEAVLADRLSHTLLAALLMNAPRVKGDYDRATVLRRVADSQTLADDTRALFVEAAETIQSEYEQGRVQAALVKAGHRAPAVR